MTEVMEVGLVLQGGGALGAYEYGGIVCLLDLIDAAERNGRMVDLRVVTGVSIGAINAACIVGAADRNDARVRLSALWDDLVSGTPRFMPPNLSSNYALLRVEHFYKMRLDLLAWPTWTYVYNTRPLLETLAKHVDFKKLNASDTAFVITAVDVETGELTPFSNRAGSDADPVEIGPHHILASGSLAPQFPWTDIPARDKVHHYWDGGIVDNTPLGYAIDAFSNQPGIDRVLVIMNLFPAAARLPGSLPEVNERLEQLRFGNRLHQDKKSADTINELVATIEAMRAHIPGELPPELQRRVENARKFKQVRTFEIALSPGDGADDDYGFRDFSSAGVETRRKTGHALTLAKLGHVFQ